MPFQQFVVKVNSRCNLACRYCYMYFAADTGWRRQPVTADAVTLRQIAHRIGEHVTAHGLRALSLVLHGGEPLLTDPAVLGAFAADVRDRAGDGCSVRAAVQTNGVLLTEDKLAVLAEHGITVGLSLDGGLAAHNHQRVDHAGRPAWPAIRRAARLLAEDRHRGSFNGVLSVIDLATDPAEAYASLLALDPPAIDFLLPHGNWSRPPPGLPAPAAAPTPYGDWLCAVFDQWWGADRRRVRVRLFQECLALLLGLPAATEALGLQPFTAVVIETDGGIEQVDSLKSAYEGAAATGLNVFDHSFDQALDHPGVAARQAGTAALADACLSCPLLKVCGGGHYAHRYRAGHGFRNPSVYCADLSRLIRHIADALHRAATP
ncbi:FxsB family cyclophane-forming radical SAM/SPASM peptide maturase [Streptomyces litchfieldiae]|uniref:FxsB family cyclophane-forming radical SAM/SPASM peptide maturase n=1 Tax=Streptomyces litchfieldiae TaxID=3075543 RepID=A0ABU2MJE8_9ACTN|nr:FxsB family cyclophane-forming radical SAM/SPASM peptide maturase [Streptomyces sp. DSM 44938]MDT0341610.1 FxsB family cyclophane-forming radical SAM/SPASM peptide maturase [Streptomyces sp. DSM 44938]